MILKGDALTMPFRANSVDAIVTDPPYGLEFMGKEWDKLWAKRDGREIELPPDKNGKKHGTHPFLQAKVDKYQGGLQAQLWHTQWLTEAYRVLKPGGSMLVMGGTRTSHRLACAIEDSGFIIKDTLMWIYGSGFPKAQDLGKMIKKRIGRDDLDYSAWDGFKVGGIKPAYEPIIWAVKPPEGSYVDNVLKWGVGAVNVDECRIGYQNGKDKNSAKWGHQTGNINDYGKGIGDMGNKDILASSKGRFPANVILSHHPECVQVGVKVVKSGKAVRYKGVTGGNIMSRPKPKGTPDMTYADSDGLETVESWRCHPDCAVRLLDEQSGNLQSGRLEPWHTDKGKIKNVFGKYEGRAIPKEGFGGDSGGASRFFYCAKASRSERNLGLEGMKENTRKIAHPRKGGGSDDWGDRVGHSAEAKTSSRNNHPTVKPIKLFEWLIKLVTREGQTVLDPFIGSGTTAIAAHNTGRKCVGIEKEGEYLEIAKKRISYHQKQPVQMQL